MSCPGITDFVVRESGRYMPGQIFRQTFGSSLWVSLMTRMRGTFPAGLSQIINVLTYGRSAPDEAEPTWSNVTVVDGQEGGACLPQAGTIDPGSTTRNFQLARRALNGPDFCAEEFRSVFDMELQLDQITEIMKERVRIEWEIHNRSEYQRMVDTKVVVNGCSPAVTENASGSATYPAVEATQTLGMGLLDIFKFKLIRNGAASSALLTQNGMPIFTVIASPELIGNIIRNNSDIRQDVRWADSGKGDAARLLQAFGINNTYNGYMFLGDLEPRRFNFTGGVHVQVPQYLRYAVTKGYSYKINPAWETASEEEVLIFDTDVMNQLVPQPITNPSPNFRFNPISYMGDIGIRNIPDRVCNPDSNIIFHRAIMAAASMPKKPWKGVAFLVKRCDPACGNATSCSS